MKKSKIFLLVLIIILTNLITFNLGRNLNSYTLAANKGDVDKIESDQVNKLIYLENYINSYYLRDVTKEDLYTGQLKGMVAALNDPYSQYLTEEEFNELMEDTTGTFFGIGVYISSSNGYVTVVSPIRNTPAEEAGLLPGDIILKVDGVEVSGEDVSKASKLIKGKKGTDVLLTIVRKDENEKPNTFDLKVRRDEIEVITVNSKTLENNILYISISQFNDNTYKEFAQALEEIKADTKGIILDLRSNPGGLLDACRNVADTLLPEGLIYYTKDRQGQIIDEGISDANMVDLPMVTLINGGSASASEILSGALRDHKRSILIGEKSFGKGVVQTINRFSTRDGIKLTISEYFTPNGISIHEKGIVPDVEVKLDDKTTIIGVENLENDNQLQRAIEELKKII
ncbi:S41 family peptidase [Neofamilia massiliensis]|uniref:S41 family peptidase n=1 Tax=Neofamilia massiliensis TaxID=1673724 RepID=UPI0006BB6669|nr:S41 family peptidase [Neofamilia massiliensis]